MMAYSWPGNIRQLESVLERAYIMCEESVIGVEHVPEEIKHDGIEKASGEMRVITDYLIDAKLTAAEYRLYLHLMKLESVGGKERRCLSRKPSWSGSASTGTRSL